MVIAFAGSRKAIIGGDKRSITFLGSCSALEEELYSGKIRNDEDLVARSKELGASLQVADGREKVWKLRREDRDLLIGEVTEISLNSDRRRRIYLAPGAYLMAEIADGNAKITGQGKTGCIVLGNKLTQRLAGEAIKKAGGRMDETVMRSIFADAGEKTASVSKDYAVFTAGARQTDPTVDPMDVLIAQFKEDCEKSGWRLCGQCGQQ